MYVVICLAGNVATLQRRVSKKVRTNDNSARKITRNTNRIYKPHVVRQPYTFRSGLVPRAKAESRSGASCLFVPQLVGVDQNTFIHQKHENQMHTTNREYVFPLIAAYVSHWAQRHLGAWQDIIMANFASNPNGWKVHVLGKTEHVWTKRQIWRGT